MEQPESWACHKLSWKHQQLGGGFQTFGRLRLFLAGATTAFWGTMGRWCPLERRVVNYKFLRQWHVLYTHEIIARRSAGQTLFHDLYTARPSQLSRVLTAPSPSSMSLLARRRREDAGDTCLRSDLVLRHLLSKRHGAYTCSEAMNFRSRKLLDHPTIFPHYPPKNGKIALELTMAV